MEGTPFEAKSMKPIDDQGVATPGRDDDRRVSRVMVVGDSIVQAQPDTAIVTVSVVTQDRRALDAQQENAAKTDAVVRALKAAAGTGAEVKTSGYSLQPMRVYKEDQPPAITGYEARNSVTVTLGELNKLGTSSMPQRKPARTTSLASLSRCARIDKQKIARSAKQLAKR